MKKLLLVLTLVVVLALTTSTVSVAQCNQLFFSEYVEGTANNKALEIYNPTNNPINLGDYSIARFDNGNITASPEQPEATIVGLPDEDIMPGQAYVVVLDMQEVTVETMTSTFDKPVWNGYMVVQEVTDEEGNVILDSEGNPILEVAFDENFNPLFNFEQDATYYPQFDLQGKADAFLCPIYEENKTMYFNGNDAMGLILGSEVVPDYSNVVDVIGVIGEDPEVTIGEPAWVSSEGFWLTRNSTLRRNFGVEAGRTDLSDIYLPAGGSFTGEEWFDDFSNTFDYLGWHACACQPTGISENSSIPVKMYPNPTQGLVQIEAPFAIQNISVFNVLGQQVLSQDIGGSINELAISTNTLNSGLHTVYVTFTNNQSTVKKLMVK